MTRAIDLSHEEWLRWYGNRLAAQTQAKAVMQFFGVKEEDMGKPVNKALKIYESVKARMDRPQGDAYEEFEKLLLWINNKILDTCQHPRAEESHNFCGDCGTRLKDLTPQAEEHAHMAGEPDTDSASGDVMGDVNL